MTHIDFDKLVEYAVTKMVKEVMCAKSVEYARGGDKLYNFKRAAEVSGRTPLQCLQGMKLKHDVSILDMLDDETNPHIPDVTQEKWEEKIGDDINYLILMLALLYEDYGWKIPGVTIEAKEAKEAKEEKAGPDDGRGNCGLNTKKDCNKYNGLENGCIRSIDHPNWRPKK